MEVRCIAAGCVCRGHSHSAYNTCISAFAALALSGVNHLGTGEIALQQRHAALGDLRVYLRQLLVVAGVDSWVLPWDCPLLLLYSCLRCLRSRADNNQTSSFWVQ